MIFADGEVTSVFVAGTDTGVGKTYVTALLLRALRAQGVDAVGFKPICCGSREDAEILHAAAETALDLNEVNPVWFRAPAAPYTASLVENRAVDLALIRETFATLRNRHQVVLVEGVGGWLVPITREFSMADLAREFALPVVLVVRNQLGALNHTALTVHHIRACGLICRGLLINEGSAGRAEAEAEEAVATTTNAAVLEDWLALPVLHTIGRGQSSLEALRLTKV